MKKPKALKNLLKDQKGQGVMEYVIITSLIGVVCLTAVKQLGDSVNNRVKNIKETINNKVQLHK